MMSLIGIDDSLNSSTNILCYIFIGRDMLIWYILFRLI